MKKRNRKSWMYLLLIMVLLSAGLGYGLISSDLSIDGIMNVSTASWNVYWNNVQVSSGSVSDVTTPARIKTGNTEVEFAVRLSEMGEFYEFTVDAVNGGTIDAMIDVITTATYESDGTTVKTLPAYLGYTVNYADGIPIEKKHILEAGETQTYRIKVYFRDDITASQLPSENDQIRFKFGISYIQKTSAGISKPAYSYTISETNNYIGQALPAVTVYDNYQDAITAFDHNVFLRHKLANNVVSESYVGFVINSQDYYLKGGDGGASYATNKSTLLSAFGSSNCQVDASCGEVCQYTYCSLSGLHAVARSDGYVDANVGSDGCSVSDDSSSRCIADSIIS